MTVELKSSWGGVTQTPSWVLVMIVMCVAISAAYIIQYVWLWLCVCVCVFFFSPPPTWNVMCLLGNGGLKCAWATKGWRTSLARSTQSSCVCVSVLFWVSHFPGMFRLLPKEKVTTMVCTHNTAETQGWLKKAWKWGDGPRLCPSLPVFLPPCDTSCLVSSALLRMNIQNNTYSYEIG